MAEWNDGRGARIRGGRGGEFGGWGREGVGGWGLIRLGMYEISVDAAFSAAHAISIAGQREPNHGHNWHVTVTIAGPTLDADGLLCDFHTVHEQLMEIVSPMDNADLNQHAAFARQNASAELVARYIADELNERLGSALAQHAKLVAVRVTEALGCAATYRP